MENVSIMVFEKIYDLFTQITRIKLEQHFSEQETLTLIENGDFHDSVLKEMAKSLAVAVYRNGKIEDVHAGDGCGTEDFNGIPDSCMKEINKDVCNKIYTMLKLLFSEEPIDFKRAVCTLEFSRLCASGWDDPELDEDIYVSEELCDSVFNPI